MEPKNLPGSFQTFRFHLHASEFSLLITFLMKVAAVASSECSVQQRQCRCGLLLVVSCVLCVVSWLLALACWPLEWGSMVLGELGGQQSGQSVGGSFPGNDRHSPGFIWFSCLFGCFPVAAFACNSRLAFWLSGLRGVWSGRFFRPVLALSIIIYDCDLVSLPPAPSPVYFCVFIDGFWQHLRLAHFRAPIYAKLSKCSADKQSDKVVWNYWGIKLETLKVLFRVQLLFAESLWHWGERLN